MDKMENNTAFCIDCGKNVEYDIENIKVSLTVRGVAFSYWEKNAYCKKCGKEVYVAALNDMNADARAKAYERELARRESLESAYGLSKEKNKEKAKAEEKEN